MLRNTVRQWGSLARHLHWLMAGLLILQFALGKIGHEMSRSPAKLDIMSWHKSIGILLLLLVALRLTWRLLNPTPAESTGTAAWQRWAARGSHAALYLLMVALPLSGWILASAENLPMHLFWLVQWPAITGPSESLAETAEEIHEALAGGLLAMFVIHVLAALWHHFRLGDDVLRRMLSGRHEVR